MVYVGARNNGTEGKRRSALLRQMERLAGGRVNDAVKLAFLDREEMGEIDALDLSALTEFKRRENGTVEIKLTDRLAALERLLELTGQSEQEKAQALFRALEAAVERNEGTEAASECKNRGAGAEAGQTCGAV